MISYCVSVYLEKEYITQLLDCLSANIIDNEEIVVVQTYRNTKETDSPLFKDIKNIITSHNNIIYDVFNFQNDFANLKNHINSIASKPYIFNLDADEIITPYTFNVIREIINNYRDHDVFYFPRINIVENMTKEDISKYKWNVNDNGWVNWPDYQPRLYKKNEHIIWSGAVHETITGSQKRGIVDANPANAIIHKKDIIRQRQQNEFYSKNFSWNPS